MRVWFNFGMWNPLADLYEAGTVHHDALVAATIVLAI